MIQSNNFYKLLIASFFMDKLERRAAEMENRTFRITRAMDYITQILSRDYGDFFKYKDGSGIMSVKDFFGYYLSVSGNPIILPEFFRKALIEDRRYLIIKHEEGRSGQYVFGAQYTNFEELRMDCIHEEKLSDFLDIAEHPRRYVREFLAEKAKEAKEYVRWRRKHRKEIKEKEKKRPELKKNLNA